jgi:Fe-S cluster biogenesis protein NfuA
MSDTNATNTAKTPGAPTGDPSAEFKNKLETFIDTDVRPFLQQDGGDIELVDWDPASGAVKVRLQGACGTCPSSIMTLKFGVERRLMEVFPAEVRSLDLVDSPLMGMGGPHGHGHF